jgi:hypothetical protein
VVFVGSSVTGRDLLRIRADHRLEVRPPIRRGDLPAAVRDGHEFIGIIDGEFFQNLAVSPKEILAALQDGQTIVGGASMGALRAAELATHGMHGVGTIYRWYASGRVTRDDDVALKYAADDDVYMPLTVPMVNVLWVTAAGRREGWLCAESARLVTAAARRMHWSMRTWPQVADQARLAGAERRTLFRYALSPEHDLKRLDALAVVAHLQRVLSGAGGEQAGRPGQGAAVQKEKDEDEARVTS